MQVSSMPFRAFAAQISLELVRWRAGQEASKVKIGIRFSSKSSNELRLTSRDPRSEHHKEQGLGQTLTPSPDELRKHFSKNRTDQQQGRPRGNHRRLTKKRTCGPQPKFSSAAHQLLSSLCNSRPHHQPKFRCPKLCSEQTKGLAPNRLPGR